MAMGQFALRAYVAAIFVLGVLLASAGAPGVTSLAVVGYSLAAGAAQYKPVQLREGVSASLIGTVVITAALTHGWEVAVVSGAVGGLVNFLTARGERALKAAFNVGSHALAAGLGSLAFEALGGLPGDAATFATLQGALALTVLVVLYDGLTSFMVAGVVRLASGEQIMETLRSSFAGVGTQVLFVGMSVIAAVLVIEVGAWALLFLAVPAGVVQVALRGFEAKVDAFDNFVLAFVTAIEVKDGYTRGHALRVGTMARKVAEKMGMGYAERRLVYYAALLHDLGKINIPLSILNKPSRLTDEEFDVIKQHPRHGFDILEDIEFLQPSLDVVRYHHERLDGRGYPYGVGADDIPLSTRIVTVVDAYDAMTTTRSYRPAMPVARALEELRRNDVQFDQECVTAFLEAHRENDWVPEPVKAGMDPSEVGEALAPLSDAHAHMSAAGSAGTAAANASAGAA